MKRIQMFDTPHKALRMALGELLVLAGKTDFSSNNDIRTLQGLMRDVNTLIHSHSHVEDDLFFDALDHFTPEATEHDRAEHVRLHARLDELLASLDSIAQAVAAGSDQRDAGRDLYTDLCNFHAEMLVHMMEEERDTQPFFWQHMSDDDIRAFEPQIRAHLTPELNRLWMRYIIPSATPADRAAMFAGMQIAAPAPVFEQTLALAREVLSDREYAALARVLGVGRMAVAL